MAVTAQRLLIISQQLQGITRELAEIENPKKVTRKPTKNEELRALASDNLEKLMIKRRLKNRP